VTFSTGSLDDDLQMEKDNYAEEFTARLFDSTAWKQSAYQLLEAAKLLEPKVDEFWVVLRTRPADSSSWRPWDDEFVAIYFTLCSYAIENLLKSHIVRKKRPQLEAALTSHSGLPKLLKEHNLYKLAVEAGFKALAKEEEMLLRRLTRSALWYGRYPVPVTPGNLCRSHPSDNYDFKISLTAYTSGDRDNIRRIVKEFSI